MADQRLSNLIESRVNRRTLIRGGVIGAAGLTAAALIGCGDGDDEAPAAATAAPTAAATAAAATAAATAAAPTQAVEADYITNARAEGAPFAFNWPEPDKAPVKGGTLVYGASFGHGSFDQYQRAGQFTQLTTSVIGDMLVGYKHGPDMNLYAMDLDPDFGLATSWEVAPDGLSITFNLREANFHNVAPVNGRALVADDVVFAYDQMQGGIQSAILAGLNNVEAVDDRTARFNMDFPNADILVIGGYRQTPIYPAEVYDAGEQDTNPIGTGPAILNKGASIQDQLLVFDSNPGYWGGAPNVDAFHVQTITDGESRKAAFRTGQTHHGTPTLTEAEVDALWGSVPNMNVMNNPSLMGITVYAVNSTVEPFTDVRVRRALKLAMDVDRYLAIRYPGQSYPDALPAFGWPFLHDSYPGRVGFGEYGRHDKEEAKKLLAAAGVEDGFTWRHRGPGGFSGATDSQDSLLVEDFRDVGLNMEFLPADGPAFSAAYYGRGFSDPARRESESIQGWSTATPTANGYFWENIHSQSSSEHFNIVDPTVDDLADRQRETLDPDERRELLHEINDYVNDQCYLLDKVPASAGIFIVRPEVRYYRFHGPYIGIHSFWDWGYALHKTWLDPDPPAASLTTDLRG